MKKVEAYFERRPQTQEMLNLQDAKEHTTYNANNLAGTQTTVFVCPCVYVKNEWPSVSDNYRTKRLLFVRQVTIMLPFQARECARLNKILHVNSY